MIKPIKKEIGPEQVCLCDCEKVKYDSAWVGICPCSFAHINKNNNKKTNRVLFLQDFFVLFCSFLLDHIKTSTKKFKVPPKK